MRKTTAVLATLMLATGWSALARDDQGDFNVIGRAGLGGYTGGLGDTTSTGSAYGVAVNLQPWNVIGLELGYEGSRNNATDGGTLRRNGGSVMVKLAPPFVERVRPFVGAGLGASQVSVSESVAYRSDFMQELPLAAGLEFNSGAFQAGVRATYRVLIDNELQTNPVDDSGGLFDASVTVGARF